MRKKFIFAFTGLFVVFGVIFAVKKKQFAAPPPYQAPPEAVTTAIAETQEWESLQHAVGSLAAVQGVTVGAEMAGKVVKIAFESGAKVKAGDLLAQLDVANEEAQLRAAEAAAELARLNWERAQELRARSTNSQADLDAAAAQARQAAAQIDAIRAVIAKKTIRAPFDGHLGIRLVNLGQTLKEGEAVVSVQSLDPIYVNFTLPQQRLAELAAGLVVRVATDALPGRTIEGRITAVSPEIDAATRTVRVQATLANPDEQLRPGMFVNVEVVAPETKQVVAVPATAVYYQAFGDSIFVAKEARDPRTGGTVLRAEQRFVQLGEARGDFVSVLSGVRAGETVVTSGVFKLSNGTVLLVDNSLAPKAELAPEPGNS